MKDPKLATRLDLSDTLNYDNGKLKDATTPTAKDGTLINSWLLSDIRTVFTRAVKIAGTVFSGNFDTDNSSQLFDALKVAITGQSDWEEITSFDGNSTQNPNPSEDDLMIRLNGGYVEIFGVYYQGTTGNGFNGPAKYVPAKTKYRMIRADIGTGEISMSIDGGNAKVYLNGGISSQSVYVNGRYKL